MFRIITLILISLFIFACSSPSDSNYDDSYAPLSIEDITQQINLADSSTILSSIIGKTKRSDGKIVFIETHKYALKYETLVIHVLDTVYVAISNGYYVSTSLTKADTNSPYFAENPFREQRIAKPYPENEDSWIKVLSQNGSDYLVAKKSENFQTLFGTVENVFSFETYGDDDYPGNINFYGKSIGWLGTTNSSGFSIILCSYKKVSGKEYGMLWPEKPLEIRP